MGALKLFPTLTPVYTWNKACEKKIKVNQGGTNSSKTYSIIQVIIDHLIANPNWTATITAESWPTLERGALKDFKTIIRSNDLLKHFIPDHKLKKGPYYFFNGSKIEFVTVKNPLDARHGKREILFVNEANAMDYDTVDEMVIRTTKHVFIDYNPNARFWVHDLYIGREDVQLFISNYTHNPFCPKDVINNIRMYYREWKKREKRGDQSYHYWKNKYNVYGRGITGIVQGVIFENTYYRATFPLMAKRKAYVVDWGFSIDPTAVALCGVSFNKLYGKELIYERGLTTPDLIKRFEKIGIRKSDLIICDTSNPDGIGILRQAGYKVIEAHKGPNSRKAGVQTMLGYDIWIIKGVFSNTNIFSSSSTVILGKPLVCESYNMLDAIMHLSPLCLYT